MTKKILTAISVLAIMAGTAPAVSADSGNMNYPSEVTAPKSVTLNGATIKSSDDETPWINYGYCGSIAGGMSVGECNDTEVSAAFYIPLEDVKRYAGAKITEINVASGMDRQQFNVNNITDVTVFVSDDIYGGTYITRQRGRLSKKTATWSTIKLSNPVEIKADQPLFIGATVIVPTNYDLPFCTDGVKTYNGKSFFLDYYLDGEHHVWEDMTSQAGSVCITAKIEGSALPTYDLELSNLSYPRQISYNTPVEVSFRLNNRGANDVTSAKIEFSLGGSSQVIPTTLPQTLAYNQSQTLYLTISCMMYGYDIPLSFRITEVNGKPDTFAANDTVTGYVVCMREGEGYDRMIVMEEGTGTWCPNCPRGLLAMEYMMENYPDEFIGIAIHGGQDEPMAVASRNDTYTEHVRRYTSYPNARFNREPLMDSGVDYDFKGQMEGVRNKLKATKSPAHIAIESVEFTDDTHSAIRVNTASKFTFNNDTDYGIAIVLTENGVGPHKQSNNFYGLGEQFGVFNTEVEPSIVFGHVARYISSYFGDPTLLPEQKKADTEYKSSVVLPLTELDNAADYDIVALLINRGTGAIDNAAKLHGSPDFPLQSGIEGVETPRSNASVAVNGNSVIISGEYDSARVVGLDGVTVATMNGDSSIALPNGFYLVEIDGAVTKIVIR